MSTVKSDLDKVFAHVKSRFIYTAQDVERWASAEELDGEVHSDCNDFALACRAECRAVGVMSRLVVCLTETGERHLVLESVGWVLDNRQNHVVSRARLPYTWLKISGYEAGDPWRAIV